MGAKNGIEDIYQDMRTKILTNVYYPGQKLSETQLATGYNCSRTPVREILKQLENDGLIIIKPKSGTYVKPETPKDYIELMQVRAYLESLAYNLLIQNCTDRDIKKLEKINKGMDDLIETVPMDMMKFARLHYDFHYNFVCISGNEVLIRMFERLNLRSSHMFYKSMDHDKAVDTQGEHEKIINFLRNKDPEGEKFVCDHLIQKANRAYEP